MSRRLRPHLPGVPFHLTARVQNREPLLLGHEARIAELIRVTAAQERCVVLAYAVMPNHLHVLLLQGERPLSSFMQPLLRRIALLVHRAAKRDGHVFGRRFADRPCLDPQYLRDCITYIHLNPVRADLCGDPAQYGWTSHELYARPTSPSTPLALWSELGLRAFASDDSLDRASLCAAYHRYVMWRVEVDGCDDASDASRRAPPPPLTAAGDANWWRTFGVRCEAARAQLRHAPRAADLSDIARACLADAPDSTMDLLRSGGRSRALVQLRLRFIERATIAGHRTAQIARYLRVSQSLVSSIAAPLRTPAA